MNEEKINQLLALSKKRVEISDKKMEVVREQKYEQAAALRDQERKIIEEIDTIVDIDEDKYEVSLTLAILQNLLTNCIELFNGLSRKEQKENPITNDFEFQRDP